MEYIEYARNLYFDKISEVILNDWEAKVSANAKLSEPEHLSDEKKKIFLAQTKTNVKIEEKSLYEDLLCKHFGRSKTRQGN